MFSHVFLVSYTRLQWKNPREMPRRHFMARYMPKIGQTRENPYFSQNSRYLKNTFSLSTFAIHFTAPPPPSYGIIYSIWAPFSLQNSIRQFLCGLVISLFSANMVRGLEKRHSFFSIFYVWPCSLNSSLQSGIFHINFTAPPIIWHILYHLSTVYLAEFNKAVSARPRNLAILS